MPEAIFTPQASDYGELQRIVFRQQLRSRRFVRRLSVLLLGAAIIVAIMMIAVGESAASAIGLAIVSAAFGTVGLFIVLAGTYLLVPRRAARIFRQQRTLHHPMRTSWSSEGLVLTTPHGETRYPWRELHGWAEGSGMVLIQASDLLCYFVPKRCLDSASLDDLRATLADSGLPRR